MDSSRFIQLLKSGVRVLSTIGSLALLLVFILASLLDALGEDPEEDFRFIGDDAEHSKSDEQ